MTPHKTSAENLITLEANPALSAVTTGGARRVVEHGTVPKLGAWKLFRMGTGKGLNGGRTAVITRAHSVLLNVEVSVEWSKLGVKGDLEIGATAVAPDAAIRQRHAYGVVMIAVVVRLHMLVPRLVSTENLAAPQTNPVVTLVPRDHATLAALCPKHASSGSLVAKDCFGRKGSGQTICVGAFKGELQFWKEPLGAENFHSKTPGLLGVFIAQRN